MSTILNAPITWTNKTLSETKVEKPVNRLSIFLDQQAKYVTMWFLVSMIVQGIFFLPLPALLIFTFNAPAYILIFTLGLFFANLIAGMSSSGIKTIVYLFVASILVNLCLLLIFVI